MSDSESQRQQTWNAAPSMAPRSRRARWLWFGAAGLAGGFAAWLLIEQFGDYFQISDEVAAQFAVADASRGNGPVPKDATLAMGAEKQRIRFRNTSLSMGLAGLSLGGMLGLAVTASRKSKLVCIAGVAMGIGLGTIFGVLGALSGQLVGSSLAQVSEFPQVYRPIVVQGVTWLVLTSGIGLVVGFFDGTWKQSLQKVGMAILAGLFALTVFHFVSAFLAPMSNFDQIIPTGSTSRLAWSAWLCGVIGLSLGREECRNG